MLTELEYVQRSAAEKPILLVAAQGEPLPLDLPEDAPIVYRSPATMQMPEEFAQRIATWLMEGGYPTEQVLVDEPRRLLERKEYAPAVISAVRVLEASLRRRLSPERSGKRAQNLSEPLAEAESLGVLPEGARASARDWIGLRNEIVHFGRHISAQTSRSVVRKIMGLVDQLQ